MLFSLPFDSIFSAEFPIVPLIRFGVVVALSLMVHPIPRSSQSVCPFLETAHGAGSALCRQHLLSVRCCFQGYHFTSPRNFKRTFRVARGACSGDSGAAENPGHQGAKHRRFARDPHHYQARVGGEGSAGGDVPRRARERGRAPAGGGAPRPQLRPKRARAVNRRGRGWSGRMAVRDVTTNSALRLGDRSKHCGSAHSRLRALSAAGLHWLGRHCSAMLGSPAWDSRFRQQGELGSAVNNASGVDSRMDLSWWGF